MGDRQSLVGRAMELSRLDRFIEQVVLSGAGLHLFGDPGVGKTVLLEATLETARSRRLQVYAAAGSELETELEHATLHQLLLQAPTAGLDVLPEEERTALAVALGTATGPSPDVELVAGAVATLLAPPASSSGTLIAVDDAQWMDPASRAVVDQVGRRLSGSRLGLLTAARGVAPVESGVAPAGKGELPCLEIGPLDDESIAALIDVELPLTRPRRDQLLAASCGNPLALRELASVLDEDLRHVRRQSPVLHLPPGRLQRAHQAELAALPDPARRTLLLVALDQRAEAQLPGVGGVRFGTGPRAGGPDRDLEVARRARVLEPDPDTGELRFRHPLVAETLIGESTAQERIAAHRELARVHVARPLRRAWHLADASLRADDRLAELLEHGAQVSLQDGHVLTAVNALLRAADVSATPAGRSRRLAEAAYVSASVHGEMRMTPELVDAARQAQPDRRLSLPAAVAAAQVLLNIVGDVDTAHRLLSASIEATGTELGLDAADVGVVEALFELIEVCRFGARTELWEPVDTALRRLRPHVPPLLLLRVRSQRSLADITAGHLTVLDDLVSGLHRETDPARINRIGSTALVLDRGPSCHGALWRVIEDGRAGGARRTAIALLYGISDDEFAAGRWGAAQAAADECLQMCEEGGYLFPAQLVRTLHLQLAAGRGEEETVRRLAGEIIGWAAPRGLGMLVFRCHQIQAMAAIGRADFESAYSHSVAITRPGSLPTTAFSIRGSQDLVEAALATDRRDEAVAHVAALRQARVDRVSDRLALMVAGVTAMVADDDAFDLFDRALATPGAASYPWDAARIRLQYGERLRRAKATSRSRVELAAAIESFRRFGANPWAERANRELDATSATRQRADAAQPPLLTPRQREVAQHAAAGLSNREIGERLQLSQLTVAAHLRTTYEKLGITSRSALRDALPDVPPGPGGSG